MKKRELKQQQRVVIIYITGLGYVQERAVFKEYRIITIGESEHKIPVFDYNETELLGLHCFWLLEEEATEDRISYAQRQLIPVQIKVWEVAKELNYTMPEKIKDPKIKQEAIDNTDRLQKIIQHFGFDPRDERWLEDLCDNEREKKWFKFERENGLAFVERWEDIVAVFNDKFKDDLTVELAKNFSKRRMRYWLGAYHTRMSGNKDNQDWKKVAKDFEKHHRDRENRMLTWSLAHKDNFPLVIALKPIRFWPGPYLHQFLENCPQLFTDDKLSHVKEGTTLRVISYDVLDHYIRLDFPYSIRRSIKPNESENARIWIKDSADYDLWLKPEELESSLDIMESLA